MLFGLLVACGPGATAVRPAPSAGSGQAAAQPAGAGEAAAAELPYREGPLAGFARARTLELVTDTGLTPELFLLRVALGLEGGAATGPHHLALAYDESGLHLVLFEPRSGSETPGAVEETPRAADAAETPPAVREVVEAFLVEATAARAAATYPPLSTQTLPAAPPQAGDAALAERVRGATLTYVEVEAWAVLGRRADGTRSLVESSEAGPVVTSLP